MNTSLQSIAKMIHQNAGKNMFLVGSKGYSHEIQWSLVTDGVTCPIHHEFYPVANAAINESLAQPGLCVPRSGSIIITHNSVIFRRPPGTVGNPDMRRMGEAETMALWSMIEAALSTK